MDLLTGMRTTLKAAGFKVGDEEPDATGSERPTRLPVLDGSGNARTATAALITPDSWHVIRTALRHLVEQEHEHVAPLCDALTLLDAQGRASTGPDGEPAAIVLLWAVGDPARTLGAFAKGFELELWQLSAALVGCARALVFLEACGLGLPEGWELGDALLGDSGHVQILPIPLSFPAAGGRPALSRVAASGLRLLSRAAPGTSSDALTLTQLRALLTRTARGQEELTAGTFAARCHELITPVAPPGWSPRPHPEREIAHPTDLLSTWRAHVLRAEPVRPERLRTAELRTAELRTGQRRMARTPTALSRNRPHRPGRLRTGGTGTEPVRVGPPRSRLMLVGSIASAVLLGGIGWSLGIGSEQGGAGPSEQVVGDEALNAGGAQGAVENKPDTGAGIPGTTDPREAALALTAERIRILTSLINAGPVMGDPAQQDAEALGEVLVADSDLMRQDQRLLSRLRTQSETVPVRVEPGSATILSRTEDQAVVEVAYDLLSEDGAQITREATLGLRMSPDGWRVGRVSSAGPSEQP